MKPLQLLLGASALLSLMTAPTAAARPQSDGRPADLRCEHLTAPLGIDNPAPRLSWRLDTDRQGARQTAYALRVGTDSVRVLRGKPDVWESGKRSSDDMLVTCGEASLKPCTRYYWTVTVWDERGRRSTSSVAAFETGLMGTAWQGRWIDDGHDTDYLPAPYFRRSFTLAKPVRSARIHIAAAGLYELYANGERVGDRRLDPMYTRFDRRNLYVTYDVTRQLHEGANALGVLRGELGVQVYR